MVDQDDDSSAGVLLLFGRLVQCDGLVRFWVVCAHIFVTGVVPPRYTHLVHCRKVNSHFVLFFLRDSFFLAFSSSVKLVLCGKSMRLFDRKDSFLLLFCPTFCVRRD